MPKRINGSMRARKGDRGAADDTARSGNGGAAPYDEVSTAGEGEPRPYNGDRGRITQSRNENDFSSGADKPVRARGKARRVGDEVGARHDDGSSSADEGVPPRAGGIRQAYKASAVRADEARRHDDGSTRPYNATVRLDDRNRAAIKACARRPKGDARPGGAISGRYEETSVTLKGRVPAINVKARRCGGPRRTRRVLYRGHTGNRCRSEDGSACSGIGRDCVRRGPIGGCRGPLAEDPAGESL